MLLTKPLYKILLVITIILLIPKTIFAFNYYHFKLYNQLEFYLVQTKSPVVTYSTWVNAGGINEGEKQGVAHFLEHMMFRDNKTYTGEQLQQILQNTGGSYNAFTNYDYTTYYETIPFYDLDKIMKIEASRIRGLLINQQQFNEEKKVILEERGLRIDNTPIARFNEQISYYALQNNNYRRSLIGSEKDILNITKDDVLNFYHKYYRPDNIKIFVIGNVSPKKLKSLARKYYNDIQNPRRKLTIDNAAGAIEYTDNTEVKITSNKVLQNIYALSYLAPSYKNTNNQSEVMALYLLSMYLNSSISEFNQSLITNKKLVADLVVNYDYNTKLNTNFMIYFIPNKSNSFQLIMNETNQQLQNLIKKGIPAKDFKLLIDQFKYNNVYLQDSESSYLLVYANFIMNGFSTKQFLNIEQQVDKLDLVSTNQYIAKFLQQNKMVIKLTNVESK